MVYAYILFGVIALVSWLVQNNLQRKFDNYSKIPLTSRMTGKEVAEKMLHDNGVHDVRVISTNGHLTDHFNPTNKTVNLSQSVYASNSVAAAAVAAHECGHAIQHAKGYAPLKMRSALVPIVSFSSRWISIVILAGIILLNVFPQLLLIGICLFATTTLFSLITLPVEIDASKRALAWLEAARITSGESQAQATSALKSAAYTYIVAALSSMATLFYYLMIFLGRRRN